MHFNGHQCILRLEAKMSLLFSMLISCFGFPWHCFNFGHILKVLGLRFFCFLLCFAVVLFVRLCCFILFFVLLLLNSSMITRDLTCDSYTVTFGGGTRFPPLPFFRWLWRQSAYISYLWFIQNVTQTQEIVIIWNEEDTNFVWPFLNALRRLCE